MFASPRLLSIQSHVVSGYVGNKSATFPLQLLGFEVDVINTVQLSNHTQYKVSRGQIFGSNELDELRSGLQENNLLSLYNNVLSGYVADVSYIKSMGEMIKHIKAERIKKKLNCSYTLDPVLGDDGIGYYVPAGETVAQAYRDYLLPLADIITPNRFEASILSSVNIDTSSQDATSQAIRAINVFHDIGVKVVVLTSLEMCGDKDRMICIASYKSAEKQYPEVWTLKFPKLAGDFTGTGDLFTALITAWLIKTNHDIRRSLENTVNSIHTILEDTLEWSKKINDGSVQSRELRLIQNKESLECPTNKFKAFCLSI